eukprot:6455591-Amphidinium_carterae.1
MMVLGGLGGGEFCIIPNDAQNEHRRSITDCTPNKATLGNVDFAFRRCEVSTSERSQPKKAEKRSAVAVRKIAQEKLETGRLKAAQSRR